MRAEIPKAPSFIISLTSDPLLLKRDRFPFATGCVRYFDTDKRYPASEARIVIPLQIASIPKPIVAVMDTAAPWCIFEPTVADALVHDYLLLDPRVALSTRFGLVHGSLYRGPITIPAEEADPLDLEATVFLSPDWRGPNFIGYQGLLQRIRFAVDPEENLFYFGRF